MTEQEPDRPAQYQLEDALENTVEHCLKEWDLTSYDVVGVLTVMAARYAHQSIPHEECE